MPQLKKGNEFKPFDVVDAPTAIEHAVHESSNDEQAAALRLNSRVSEEEQGETMTGECEIVETLPKAFCISVLLTGSVQAAEAVVSEGIAALELDQISSDSLLLATVKSAILRRAEFLEQSEGLSILPLELRRLFLLAANHRDCFVLRVLIGLIPELCSGILHLSIHEAEDALYAALQELPRIETYDMDRPESVHPAQDEKVDSCAPTSGETRGY